MYQIRTPGLSKKDLAGRWALPDRVFFACGACHILAHVFLERYGPAFEVVWIRPDPGFIGNHVFVAHLDRVFDYHGVSERSTFLSHTWSRARRRWPGWNAALVAIPPDVLVSEQASRRIDGLWLREPGQFMHDPLPRARLFLDRMALPLCLPATQG